MEGAKQTEHRALVLKACRWLRSHQRCQLVLAEPWAVWGENPDAIGWTGTFSSLVEVKTSRGDFLRERHKRHHVFERAGARNGMGAKRYFLMPRPLALRCKADVTASWAGWGLLAPSGRGVGVVLPAAPRSLGFNRKEADLLVRHGSRIGSPRWEWIAEEFKWRCLDKKAVETSGGPVAHLVLPQE